MPDPVLNNQVVEDKIAESNGTPPITTIPANEKSTDTPIETAPVVEPVVEVDKSAEAISKINETLVKQTELLNTLASKVDSKAEEKEWTLEQLREAELKVYSGEYEQKWLPLINEKRATIIAKQIASDEKAQYTRDNTWNEINTRWNNGIQRAVQDFGKDASDPNSKLFKTAQDLLFKDPNYRRFNDLKNSGVPLSKIDPSLIDPDLQYKCFEIADSRIQRAAKSAPNVNPQGNGSKSSLGGATLPKADADRIQSLEARATNDPNDRQAWLELMKTSIQKNRSQS